MEATDSNIEGFSKGDEITIYISDDLAILAIALPTDDELQGDEEDQ